MRGDRAFAADDVSGVKRVGDRRVLYGIFWRLRTGPPWADIRQPLGSARPLCFTSINGVAGASARNFEPLAEAYDDDMQMIDSSTFECTSMLAPPKPSAVTIP